MPTMINRFAPIIVIALSASLVIGCSTIFGNPREKANSAIEESNESIAQHNELFNQARDTYSEVKKEVESGGDPSKQKDRITETKNNLEEARSHLEEARESLQKVPELEVDPTVKKYASLLSNAMEAQLSAEAKEIEFYGILEKDPALKNEREQALNVLDEVGDGYRKAEELYAEARELADSNQNVLGPGPPPEEEANPPPETPEETTDRS